MARRRFRVRFKKKINIPRVVAKTSGTIIALYVGNEIITQIGNVVVNTSGPFNTGFKLIGWTVGNTATNGTAYQACDQTGGGYVVALTSSPTATCITDTSGAGILAVVGIVGIASIVMEFVEFNL